MTTGDGRQDEAAAPKGAELQSCGPEGDVCVIDTEALKAQRASRVAQGTVAEMVADAPGDVLLIVLRGTYGRIDDPLGAVLAANGMVAKGLRTTLLMVDDGVYLALRGQDPSGILMAPTGTELADFIELGGRAVVHGPSLESRGLRVEDLLAGTIVADQWAMGRLCRRHPKTLTF